MNDMHHELSRIRSEELRAAAARRRMVAAAKAGRPARSGLIRSLFSRNTAYWPTRERPALS